MSRKEVWRLVFVLFLGQVVSFCLAVAGFASSFITNLGADVPLTQSSFTYLSLVLVFGAIFLYRQQKLQVPWYWYVILAVADVQGNYLVNKAYQYSSITSVTLLNCWSIPLVIILTWFAIGTRYSPCQLFGAAISVAGLVLVLLSDAGVSGGGGTNPLLGDALVIVGTLCFAFANVGEEYCLKKKDRVELLTMLGVFGLLASACEIYIFERKDLASVKWSPTMIFLLVGYNGAMYLFYVLFPFILKMSGATLLTLSLLTSDMWAVVIRIFLYNQQVDWLYYLAFVVATIGLIIYSLNETGSSAEMSIVDEEMTVQYEPLTEEIQQPEILSQQSDTGRN